MKKQPIDSSHPDDRLTIPGHDKSKNPFQVPEAYFEDLPGRIQERISGQELEKIQRSSYLTRTLIRKLAVPVLAALLITALYLFIPWQKTTTDTTSSLHDTLTLKADYDISYANDATISDFKVIEEYLDNPVNQEVSLNLGSTQLEDISEDVIIEYLNEQEIDPDLFSQL